MTFPPSPPKRRRRRIVVITIAVLVLGLGWWFWPRADQRFVGTWIGRFASRDESGEFEGYPGDYGHWAMTFRSNGTGTSDGWFGSGRLQHAWWVNGRDFWFTSSEWPFLGSIEASCFRLTGRTLGLAGLNHYFIMQVIDDRFVLDWTEQENHEGEPASLFVRVTSWD